MEDGLLESLFLTVLTILGDSRMMFAVCLPGQLHSGHPQSQGLFLPASLHYGYPGSCLGWLWLCCRPWDAGKGYLTLVAIGTVHLEKVFAIFGSHCVVVLVNAAFMILWVWALPAVTLVNSFFVKLMILDEDGAEMLSFCLRLFQVCMSDCGFYYSVYLFLWR